MCRAVCLLILSCSAVLGFAVTAVSQESVSPSPSSRDASLAPLSPDQETELTTWLTAMQKWQRYNSKWNNRPARDGLGRIAARRPRPESPEWLTPRCHAAAAADVDLDAREANACRLLDDPYSFIPSVPNAGQASQPDVEKPPKHTSFLTRIHIDGLWTTASSNNRFYGIVGSHLSLVDVGRLQVFGPPGVILLSVPDAQGSRRITLGYTWGVSVRMADVKLFGGTKDMTLFLNVSKVWTTSDADSRGRHSGYDMMGLSLAPRRKR